MTALDIDRARTALAPLTSELLRSAAAQADRTVANAQAEVRTTLERAEAEACDIATRARTAGEAHAQAELAADQARLRRTRRSELLTMQRDAYQQLRTAAITAVQRLRDDPDYPELCDRLRNAATDLLGPEATITEDSAGGILAVAGDRLLDLRLATIAVRAMQRCEPEIEKLWAP